MNLHHRTIRHAALVSCLALPAVLLGGHSSTMAQGGKKVETAGKSTQFKNILVLQEIPADQLIPLMHIFDDSLNVKCDFCHAISTDKAGKHSGFDLDTKPMKIKAREMITMAKSIKRHQSTLNGKATCYMCHHGSPLPKIEAPAGK